MTVQKRPRPEPDFEAFIEGDQIPPQLLAELERQNNTSISSNGHEPVNDEDGALSVPLDALDDYRVEVLGKAAHIVSQDRNIQYGAPEDSFDRIAAMWCAYLGTDMLMAHDVAAMLALLKIARLATNPRHEDSWVDLAGYAACGASVTKDLRDNPNLQAE
jgi:hypothetical protein